MKKIIFSFRFNCIWVNDSFSLCLVRMRIWSMVLFSVLPLSSRQSYAVCCLFLFCLVAAEVFCFAFVHLESLYVRTGNPTTTTTTTTLDVYLCHASKVDCQFRCQCLCTLLCIVRHEQFSIVFLMNLIIVIGKFIDNCFEMMCELWLIYLIVDFFWFYDSFSVLVCLNPVHGTNAFPMWWKFFYFFDPNREKCLFQ